MGLGGRIAAQLAHPRGGAGRAVGLVMDMVNRRPTSLAIDLLAPRAGELVLDAGCGTGVAAQRVLREADCRVVCVDRSGTMLASARRTLALEEQERKVAFVDADLSALPLKDGSFDAALALNVLYFCDHRAAMVSDLHRVLRRGGRLVAYVTHRASMANWSFVQHGHHRLFDAEELHELLALGGFAASRIKVHEHRITSSIRGLLAIAEA